MENKDTTITIKATTWKRLQERKCLGDSWDKIINKLIDKVNELEKKE